MGGDEPQTPTAPAKRNKGGLLELGGDAGPPPKRARTKGGLLDFGGRGQDATDGQRAVSKMLLRERVEGAGEGSKVGASVADFLAQAKAAGPGVNLEDPSADDGAETLEINLALDDLVEAKDIVSSRPDAKDNVLLPTAGTQAYLAEQQFHQQAALTSMLLGLLDKDSQAGVPVPAQRAMPLSVGEFCSPPVSPERMMESWRRALPAPHPALAAPSPAPPAPAPPVRQEALAYVKFLLQAKYNDGAITKAEFVAVAKASLADVLAQEGGGPWQRRAEAVVDARCTALRPPAAAPAAAARVGKGDEEEEQPPPQQPTPPTHPTAAPAAPHTGGEEAEDVGGPEVEVAPHVYVPYPKAALARSQRRGGGARGAAAAEGIERKYVAKAGYASTGGGGGREREAVQTGRAAPAPAASVPLVWDSAHAVEDKQCDEASAPAASRSSSPAVSLTPAEEKQQRIRRLRQRRKQERSWERRQAEAAAAAAPATQRQVAGYPAPPPFKNPKPSLPLAAAPPAATPVPAQVSVPVPSYEAAPVGIISQPQEEVEAQVFLSEAAAGNALALQLPAVFRGAHEDVPPPAPLCVLPAEAGAASAGAESAAARGPVAPPPPAAVDARTMMEECLTRLEGLARQLLSPSSQDVQILLHELRNYHFYASVAAGGGGGDNGTTATQGRAPQESQLEKVYAALSPTLRGAVSVSPARGASTALPASPAPPTPQTPPSTGCACGAACGTVAPLLVEFEALLRKEKAGVEAAARMRLRELFSLGGLDRVAPERRAPTVSTSPSAGLSTAETASDASVSSAEMRRASVSLTRPAQVDISGLSSIPCVAERAGSDTGRDGVTAWLDAAAPARKGRAPPPLPLPVQRTQSAASLSARTASPRSGAGTPRNGRARSAPRRKPSVTAARDVPYPPRDDAVEYIRSLLQPLYNSGALSEGLFVNVVKQVAADLYATAWDRGSDAWKKYVRSSIEALLAL